jgi:transcription elongation GreA/GreB family factor
VAPSLPIPDLYDAVRRALCQARDAVHAELKAARAGALTDGPERAENRGERGALTAQGFLTAALDARLGELDASLLALEALPVARAAIVGPGSLVSLETAEGERMHVLVVPGAPGGPLPEAPDVLAVTPLSPLGRALLGARVGEGVTHRRAGREDTLLVTEIA